MKFELVEGVERVFKIEPGYTYLIVTRPSMTCAQYAHLSKTLGEVSEQNKFVLVPASVVKDTPELTEFLLAKGLLEDS